MRVLLATQTTKLRRWFGTCWAVLDGRQWRMRNINTFVPRTPLLRQSSRCERRGRAEAGYWQHMDVVHVHDSIIGPI